MKKNVVLILGGIFVVLAAGLLIMAALRGTGPDLPMEVSVDGYTIALGKTAMQDLLAEGYEAHPTGVPDTVRSNANYIPFYYSLERTDGAEILVTVMVPWNGESDVSKEQELSATEGIVKSIWLRRDALENAEVYYDGADLQELTFDYAVSTWGAERNQIPAAMTYEVQAKRGYVGLAAEDAEGSEFYELTVQLSEREFEKMQK